LLLRGMKFYLVVSAFAAFLSIAMGVYMHFGGGVTAGPYCVQAEAPSTTSSGKGSDPTAGQASGRRGEGACHVDYGRILINYGRMFLVLTVGLQWPAYLYFIRRWKRRKLAPTEFALEVRKFLAPWNAALAEIFPYPFFSRTFLNRRDNGPPLPGGEWKWARIVGRSLGFYLIAAGFCVFAFLSFYAWVEFDMNHGAEFCRYDAPEIVHDFFVGNSPCQIQYLTIFFRLGPPLVYLTMLLQLPAYFYYAMYCYFHHRRDHAQILAA